MAARKRNAADPDPSATDRTVPLEEYRAAKREGARWVSGVNVLAGIWLVLAPFVLQLDVAAARWNDVLIGLAVLILALVRERKPLRSRAVSWINMVLGVWLVLAPFVLGYGDARTAAGNDVVVGIIIVVFALWSALVSRNAEPSV